MGVRPVQSGVGVQLYIYSYQFDSDTYLSTTWFKAEVYLTENHENLETAQRNSRAKPLDSP